MGLPVNLVASVTPNDIVHRTFKNGDFSLSEKVLQTWATAMDIQVPYNVERIMLIAAGLDTGRVAKLMTEFEKETKTMIPGDLLSKMQEVVVDTLMVEDEEMVTTMRRVFEENDKTYCICPHTAVGVAYFYKNPTILPQVCKFISCLSMDNIYRIFQVILATASPDKFPEAVQKAEIVNKKNPEIEKLFGMETRSVPMQQGEDWEKMLRNKIAEITNKK